MSLSLFYAGPPEVTAKVSLTPMAPLRSALEQAIGKMAVRPPLDANSCHLVLHEGGGRGGGKPVTKHLDLACPFRHANIPSTARIEVVRSSTSSAPAPTASRPNVIQSLQESERPSEAPAKAAGSSTDTDAGSIAPLNDCNPSTLSAWKTLGLDREIAVFTKQQLEAMMSLPSAQKSHKSDETDDFFELTPEDLAIMRQAQETKRKEEAVLKTRALREADETKKASQYGSVPIRIHFPSPISLGASGTIIVQAAFSPLESVSAVKQLVSKLIHSSIGTGFQLFTTPPRVVLKDLDATIFKAQLVPAANIHFTLSGDKAQSQELSYLREEVMNILLPTLDFNVLLPGQDRSRSNMLGVQSEQPNLIGGTMEAGTSSNPAGNQDQQVEGGMEGGGPGRYLGGAKLPKWMKL